MNGPIVLTEQQRRNFWAKVDDRDTADGCWPWLGASAAPPHHDGRYGTFTVYANGGRRTLKAHLVMYVLVHGQPGDLHVLHSCDNPICVRPTHLSLGTVEDNMADMRSKDRDRGRPAENRRKAHCKHGHPLSGDNLYVNPKGARQCRACARVAQKRNRSKPAAREQRAAYRRLYRERTGR